jgi:predicted transcriptional regulator
VNAFKTPSEIAVIFGCTEQQARQHAEAGLTELRQSLEKAKQSPKGKHRGLTVGWYENRIDAAETALKK